jgi:hypothetical protein
MTRHRTLRWLGPSALLIAAHAAPAFAVTPEEFRLRSGADLVALCATATTDPLYTAAIHMCHGFGAGIFQTLTALARHDKLEPIVCPPEPTPSRNETVGRFLEWSRRNPQYASEPAAELVGRFFITTFPCRAK